MPASPRHLRRAQGDPSSAEIHPKETVKRNQETKESRGRPKGAMILAIDLSRGVRPRYDPNGEKVCRTKLIKGVWQRRLKKPTKRNLI